MKCSADPSGCLSVQTPASTGSETFPGYVPWRLELPGFARRRFFRSSRGAAEARPSLFLIDESKLLIVVRPGFRPQNNPSSIASSAPEEPGQGFGPIEDPEKNPGSLYRSDQKASEGKAGSSSESERSDRLRRLSSAN
ncbi:hypothetical protein BO83DRAFT_411608 [Aspergillus eucalypticola CBS 122712]|uniref:Uncharacterized protein n=1 Tax=Aspergillus eucalypticola (strain CBS 122712 / IBT 29274) TaxID=1448314 RepID=A0A317UPR0_ASPEC|nr:uncharacterized protein BO83DRAFT_411608 [Aspergillus eucalypticola CBS 122712]PWY63954.1 hypothetical protein BO83DRAFT_411608 [Aspergillus eucalypticola CBS 122712]